MGMLKTAAEGQLKGAENEHGKKDESEKRKHASKEAASKEKLKPDAMRPSKKGKPSSEQPGDQAGGAKAPSEPDQPSGAEPGDDSAQASGAEPGEENSQPQDEEQDSSQGESDSAPSGDADDAAGDGQDDASASAGQPQAEEDGGSQGGDGDGAEQPQQGDVDDQSNPGEQDGAPQNGGSAQPSAGVPAGQMPMPAGVKEAYQKANAALATALYTNDQVAQHVLSGIVPDPQHLIESIVKMSCILFTQINKQLQFVKQTPQIVLPFAKDIVAHVIDLAVQVKKLPITPQQEQAALGATIETVMRIVGVTKQQMQNFQAHMGSAKVQEGKAKYQQHLEAIKGARPPVNAGGGGGGQSPPAGGPPPNGPAPSSGAPPGASGGATPGQPQPQPGAPVTAAPGPGQSAPPGGMLSQAAANPPQGQ